MQIKWENFEDVFGCRVLLWDWKYQEFKRVNNMIVIEPLFFVQTIIMNIKIYDIY